MRPKTHSIKAPYFASLEAKSCQSASVFTTTQYIYTYITCHIAVSWSLTIISSSMNPISGAPPLIDRSPKFRHILGKYFYIQFFLLRSCNLRFYHQILCIRIQLSSNWSRNDATRRRCSVVCEKSNNSPRHSLYIRCGVFLGI